ncbi:MAG: transposase [candidate division Zixibacteria bacterium]|nr:transposase [candidate division Zixibacteria bacterium]
MRFPQRKRIRLQGYDYSREGAYFITLCTHTSISLFGKVRNEKVELNKNGIIVRNSWFEIKSLYPSIQFDEFVLMPNHFHAILFLVGAGSPGPEDSKANSTVSSVIAHFKYLTTRKINSFHNVPGVKRWQRSFYERVIRNEEELLKAREYIQHNPLKWSIDNSPTTFDN